MDYRDIEPQVFRIDDTTFDFWKSGHAALVSAADLQRLMNDCWAKLVAQHEQPSPFPVMYDCPDCGAHLREFYGPVSVSYLRELRDVHRYVGCSALDGAELREDHNEAVWERLQARWGSKHPTRPTIVLLDVSEPEPGLTLMEWLELPPAPTEAICAGCGERYHKVPLPPVIQCSCGTTITVRQ